MVVNRYLNHSRRRFMGLVSGVFSGLFLFGPERTHAIKADFKEILGNIEVERLIRSIPRRHPEITWSQTKDYTILYKYDNSQPFLKINKTGNMIWKGCDGQNTPMDIASSIHSAYHIDAHRAYVDCLLFLASLKAKNAILI